MEPGASQKKSLKCHSEFYRGETLENWPHFNQTWWDSRCFSVWRYVGFRALRLLLTNYTGWWFQPLWKILVSWDDHSQYMEKSSKPPASICWFLLAKSMPPSWSDAVRHSFWLHIMSSKTQRHSHHPQLIFLIGYTPLWINAKNIPLFEQDLQSLPQLYNSSIQQLFVNLTTQQQRVSTFQSLAQSNTAADLLVWYTLRFLCMSLTVHCIFYTVDWWKNDVFTALLPKWSTGSNVTDTPARKSKTRLSQEADGSRWRMDLFRNSHPSSSCPCPNFD